MRTPSTVLLPTSWTAREGGRTRGGRDPAGRSDSSLGLRDCRCATIRHSTGVLPLAGGPKSGSFIRLLKAGVDAKAKNNKRHTALESPAPGGRPDPRDHRNRVHTGVH